MTKQEKEAIIKLLNSNNYDMFVTAAHLIVALYDGNIDPDKMYTSDVERSYRPQLHSMNALWEFTNDTDARKFVDFLHKLGVPRFYPIRSSKNKALGAYQFENTANIYFKPNKR